MRKLNIIITTISICAAALFLASCDVVSWWGQSIILPDPMITINMNREDFGMGYKIKNTFKVNSRSTWKSAINEINNGGDGNYVINLTGSFSLPAESPDNPRITSNSKVSIRGGGHTITLLSNGSILYIGSGKTVILRGPTLNGKDDNFVALVSVHGGAFYLRDGVIKDNYVNGDGGGVDVQNSGSFIMSGGAISGNTVDDAGGGVYVSGGSFTMSGGTISGNTSLAAAGGVFVFNTVFTMSGGTISGNNSGDDAGGGLFVQGSGSFTMSGGAISGNNAGSGGGGVMVYSTTFTMRGGEIGGNNSDEEGGGVYVTAGGTFNMHGGAISGNTAPSGGGVFVGGSANNSGTFTKTGGIIYGDTNNVHTAGSFENTATSGDGHAVYFDGLPIRYRNPTAGPGVNVTTTGNTDTQGNGFWQN